MDKLLNALCAMLGIMRGSWQVNQPSVFSDGLVQAAGNPQTKNPLSVPSEGTALANGQNFVQVLPLNKTRRAFIILNVGNTVIAVSYDSPPSVSGGKYTTLLQASGVAADGTGGLMIDELWKGTVYLQSASGTGTVNVTELI